MKFDRHSEVGEERGQQEGSSDLKKNEKVNNRTPIREVSKKSNVYCRPLQVMKQVGWMRKPMKKGRISNIPTLQFHQKQDHKATPLPPSILHSYRSMFLCSHSYSQSFR